MIIECPHCLARFRLDPRQLADSRSMLKCTRCRRVFPAPTQAPPPRPRRKPPGEENLSFSFDDDDEWSDQTLATDDLPEEQFLLNVPGGESRAPHEADAPRHAKPAPPARDEDERATREEEEEDEDEAVGAGDGISLVSVFVFLVLVVGGYGALTWGLLDDPEWAQRLTQTLPVIGKHMRTKGRTQEVALIGVQGRYERTKEGKLVFLITGKAVNHSADSLKGVQILARLYAGDHPVDQQVTFCGNPLEARIRDLSIHQVAILRGIKPPPEFDVQPGGQCPFVSIFLDVPPTIGAFSTEVAKAQRHV